MRLRKSDEKNLRARHSLHSPSRGGEVRKCPLAAALVRSSHTLTCAMQLTLRRVGEQSA